MDMVCAPMPFVVGVIDSYIDNIMSMPTEEGTLQSSIRRQIHLGPIQDRSLLPSHLLPWLLTIVIVVFVDIENSVVVSPTKDYKLLPYWLLDELTTAIQVLLIPHRSFHPPCNPPGGTALLASPTMTPLPRPSGRWFFWGFPYLRSSSRRRRHMYQWSTSLEKDPEWVKLLKVSIVPPRWLWD